MLRRRPRLLVAVALALTSVASPCVFLKMAGANTAAFAIMLLAHLCQSTVDVAAVVATELGPVELKASSPGEANLGLEGGSALTST